MNGLGGTIDVAGGGSPGQVDASALTASSSRLVLTPPYRSLAHPLWLLQASSEGMLAHLLSLCGSHRLILGACWLLVFGSYLVGEWWLSCWFHLLWLLVASGGDFFALVDSLFCGSCWLPMWTCWLSWSLFVVPGNFLVGKCWLLSGHCGSC